MAKDKLTDYDATASNNTDVGGISVAEGMLPSGVNNAIREQMSHLADFASGTSGVDVLKLQDDTDTNSIKLQAPASVTADTTFTLPDGDGSADQVLKTDGAGQLGWADRHANPSLIINGAMTISQRGVSFTSSGYTLDRFSVNLSGATATTTSENVTVGGESGLPVQFTKYLKFNVSAGDNNAAVWHKVEDVTSVPEGKVTLSFYAKGTNPNGGSVMVYVSQIFGSGGSSEVAVTSPHENITLTSSWQRFEITLDVPSLSGKTIGTNSYFWIIIGQPSGDTSTNAWALDITGVKLEIGSTATDFIHEDYGTTLAKCQRYYEEIGNRFIWSGNTTSGIAYYNSAPFTVNKRAVPTITLTNSDNSGFPATASSIAGGAATVSAVRMARSSNATTNGGYYSDNITADAEL